MLKDQCGILLLLYTVMCTKGISEICFEMSDPTEPMIDSTYGYGSQSLINLMLTGRAVSHVWDHDQDISGLSEIIFPFSIFNNYHLNFIDILHIYAKLRYLIIYIYILI